MGRKRIRRGSFTSVKALVEAIEAYLAEHNRDPKPFVWTKNCEHIFSVPRVRVSQVIGRVALSRRSQIGRTLEFPFRLLLHQ